MGSTPRALRAAVSQASRAWSPRALLGHASTPLFRNAAYLWLNTILAGAFGFVFWTAAARLYPADAVGYAASAIAAITLIAGFSHLGLGIGIIRFLPERKDSAAGLVNSVFLVTAGASLLASSVFLLGLDLWAPGLRAVREHPVFFATFVAGAVAFSLSYVLDQVLVATRRAHFVLIKNAGLALLRIALVVTLALFFASFGIVAAHAVAAGALVAAGLVVLLPAALEGYRPVLTWQPGEIRSILSFSAGNYVGALLFLAPGNLFTVIVLNASGPEAAAYFYVAWSIGITASALSVALATSLFAEGSHEPTELRRHVTRALTGGALAAAMAALSVAAAAGLILRIFGSDYASNATTLLRLLALAGLPYLLLNLYISVARIKRRVAAIILVAGVMASVSLGSAYPLVRTLGLEGIGVAWIAGQVSALAVAVLLRWDRERGAISEAEHPPGRFTSPFPAPHPLSEQHPLRSPASAPEASIIIPAYNEAAALPIVLGKLLAVLDERFEVIVVDDGSADATAQVARAFPCRLISHERNRGKGRAVRTGIEAARGEKIIIIDADGTYPVEAIPRIAAKGHDVHILCMQYWPGERVRVDEGVKIHGVCPALPIHAGQRRSISQALQFALHLLPYLLRSRLRLDVLDVQEFPYFPVLTAALARGLRRRPRLVVTWHEVWGDYWFSYLGGAGIFGLAVERLAALAGDRTIAVSRQVALDLRRINPRATPAVIPNGVDMDAIMAAEPHLERTDVIYTGRLLPHKGVDLLIRSLSLLNGNGRPLRCAIVGEGPSRPALEALARRLGVSHLVCWLPGLPDGELYRRLRASRLAVLPSQREGFGLAVAEANAAGLPVVVVDHPMNAARRLVVPGKNGFLCPPTPQDLAEAIERTLCVAPDLAFSCRQAAGLFSWDRVTDELERLYLEVGAGP